MTATGQPLHEPDNFTMRIDENLRPLFIASVQNKLNGLHESAFGLASTSERRAGIPDFYGGIVVLDAVMEEAPKVRTNALHRNIGSRILLLNKSDVHESFRELGEEYRETQPEGRARLLRSYFESLRNRPERYVDPHLVIGIYKLTKHNDRSSQFRELGTHKTEQLKNLTAFMLAVQGHAANKQTHPFEQMKVYAIPEPRNGTKSRITTNSRT